MQFTPESYAIWARHHQVPVASEATRQYLTEQLEQYRPKQILEVWAAVGSTSCRLGKQCAHWQGSVLAYEVSYPPYQLARRWRNATECRNVHLYHADFTQIDLANQLTSPIDFVFIDGMKAQYAWYLQQMRPFCHSGTCVILDDVRSYTNKMDTLWQYLEQEKMTWSFVDLDDGDGIVKLFF
jgi:predicted O-methyltransferase YrrM